MYSLEVQHFIFRISHKRFQKTLPLNSKLGQPYSVWDWRQNKKSLLAFLKVDARGKIIYHSARLSFAIKTNQVVVSELLEQFGVVYTALQEFTLTPKFAMIVDLQGLSILLCCRQAQCEKQSIDIYFIRGVRNQNAHAQTYEAKV